MDTGDKPQNTISAITSLEQLREKMKDVILSLDTKIRSLPENSEKQFLRGFRDGLARSVIECDKQMSLRKG